MHPDSRTNAEFMINAAELALEVGSLRGWPRRARNPMPRRLPPSPQRVTWKPGKPCHWDRPLAVAAAFNGVGRHHYRLEAYVGQGRPLHISVSHAGQWSMAMMQRYPEFFSAKDRTDASQMIADAFQRTHDAQAIESDYDENKSWFGLRYAPVNITDRRRGKHRSPYSSVRVHCRKIKHTNSSNTTPIPYCTGSTHPQKYEQTPADSFVQWRLKDPDLDFASMQFRTNGMNQHAWACCKDMTVEQIYMAPYAHQDISIEGAVVREEMGVHHSKYEQAIYHRVAGLSSSHALLDERTQLRARMVQLDQEAANLMRCVEAGVAWRVSFGLNKRLALQAESR